MKNHNRVLTVTLLGFTLWGCTHQQAETEMQVVPHVDINRFMGPWYVIANIPTFLERDILSPIETYRLNEDGTIDTLFRFRKEAGGPVREMEATGFVRDKKTNAIWGMQFIWPFKADYRIVYLDPDYQHTIIGRNKRDYVWIMARTPGIPEARLQELIDIVVALGYERDKIQLTNWQTGHREAS
ncbi:MAG: lipocalin family protein [Pseudomonadales bacterium]|nr:lipocalin family protein [Pseudomonadales bacterium]